MGRSRDGLIATRMARASGQEEGRANRDILNRLLTQSEVHLKSMRLACNVLISYGSTR